MTIYSKCPKGQIHEITQVIDGQMCVNCGQFSKG
jgi:NAD-dependent dihydropyrimidine dehydrogenase PreA subunit